VQDAFLQVGFPPFVSVLVPGSQKSIHLALISAAFQAPVPILVPGSAGPFGQSCLEGFLHGFLSVGPMGNGIPGHCDSTGTME
jgi:hypothetical protein